MDTHLITTPPHLPQNSAPPVPSMSIEPIQSSQVGAVNGADSPSIMQTTDSLEHQFLDSLSNISELTELSDEDSDAGWDIDDGSGSNYDPDNVYEASLDSSSDVDMDSVAGEIGEFHPINHDQK